MGTIKRDQKSISTKGKGLSYSVQTVPSIFIVFENFLSSFYSFSTRTNNYSMRKIFRNFGNADSSTIFYMYNLDFVDENSGKI